MEKEYIVTLKNRSDLDDFYTDMEASSGSGHIPDHSCHCECRRQISRNTHYHLTEAEAIELRKDPRVVAVELPIGELGGSIGFEWDDSQTGNWDRSPETPHQDITNDKNWGLKRCIDSVNASNNYGGWGSDTSGNTGSFSQVTETINTTSSGKNVDVVISDTNFGTMNGAHPEFAVNPDGTGGSRFVYLDWFGSDFDTIKSSNSITESTYDYNENVYYANYFPVYANHGVHVAGIVAGNTQGWARDANIYSISPSYYGFTPSTVGMFYTAYMDFIRHWHNSVKSINSATGRKNPTLVNQSWGIYFGQNNTQYTKLDTLNQVVYQGTTTDVTNYSSSEKRKFLEDCGIAVGNGGAPIDGIRRLPLQNAAVQADNEDAMDDGIIICNAAGNSHYNTEVENGTNWNNSLRFSDINQGNPVFYARGTVAGHTPGSIQVGATGSKGFVKEYKAGFSTYGPRVQVWAPGVNIMSSISYGGSDDPRDSNYKIDSYDGTSMASPQVCGVLACLMEQEPNLTQPEAVQHLIETSKADQMNDYAIAAKTIGFDIGLYTSPETGTIYYTVSGYDRKSNIEAFVPGNDGDGDLFVYKGDTIDFSLQNLTGHPFYIKTSPTTGPGDQILSTWLTGTSSQGGTTGSLIWDTNANGSSGIYYYQCGNHAGMGGRIVIIDIGDAANTSGYHGSSDYFEFEKWSSSNNNRHLHYQKKRPESGSIFPHPNHKNRNESTAGVKYPRVNSVVTKTMDL